MNKSFFFSLGLASMFFASFSAALGAQTIPAKGKVTGFPSLAVDDVIHGAAVFPALSAQDLLKFQIEDLLSPNEPMSAGPETIQVPGNLFIPSQQERYSFFTITLSKPSFTALVPKGEPAELFALQFKAPFSKLVSLAQNKAPYTEMLPLVATQSFSILPETTWEQSPNPELTMNLSSKLDVVQNFKWIRPMPAPKQAFDLVVGFQKTKNSKWVPTSFLGKAPTDGKLQFSKSLEADQVYLFARIVNNAQNKIESARATFARAQNQLGTPLTVNGLPEMPTVLKLERANSKLIWENAQERTGWVAVVRNTPESTQLQSAQAQNPFTQLLTDIGSWSRSVISFAKSSSFATWAQAQSGSTTFVPALKKGEKVIFVLIDTSSEAMNPAVDTQAEPEVFTKATGLVMKSFEVTE